MSSQHGLGIPIQTYPLFENAIRGARGHTIEDHMLSMGELFARFTEVAATNPFAYYGARRTALELATVTPGNRLICFPYPKWMNAMDAVNQGAAVVNDLSWQGQGTGDRSGQMGVFARLR